MTHSLLIYNPVAGQSWRRPSPRRLLHELAQQGDRAQLLVTRGQDDATQLVRAHLASTIERVWIAGGDGTVGQVATALVDTGVPIGVIPTGTVNTVVRDWNIPLDPIAAIRTLTSSARQQTVRTWQVNQRALVLGVGVGYEARTIGRTSQQAKNWLGFASVGARGIWEWLKYDFPRVRITGDDDEGMPFVAEATQVLVANSRHYASSFQTVPFADPADRCLEILLFQGNSHWRLAAFWLGMQVPGSLALRVPDISVIRARRVHVESVIGRVVAAHINGDAVEETPLTLNPWGAISLLVPDP